MTFDPFDVSENELANMRLGVKPERFVPKPAPRSNGIRTTTFHSTRPVELVRR